MTISPALSPDRIRLEGEYVLVRPLAAEDGTDLWQAGADDPEAWRYMGGGPFASLESFQRHVQSQVTSCDPLFYAIVGRESSRATGQAALMRIDTQNRVIEVGHILFTAALRQTRGATEAMYLLARYCFEELGYRRYEWKCNVLNEKSRRAALRLGFQLEGIFRQHMIVKGQNRDTAWFSMLDTEWPERKARFTRWLDPANFGEDGTQRSAL